MFVRDARRIRQTKPPLPNSAGLVPCLLQHLRDSDILRPQGHRVISSNARMACVLARHQRRTRRRAHCAAGVALCEAHALGSETIDVRCFDFRLSITTQVAVTEIVREDENDIWLFGYDLFAERDRLSLSGDRQKHACEQNASRPKPKSSHAKMVKDVGWCSRFVPQTFGVPYCRLSVGQSRDVSCACRLKRLRHSR